MALQAAEIEQLKQEAERKDAEIAALKAAVEVLARYIS